MITLGDVLHQEGALVGDAVVLATRIEALTPPDEIYVAETAWLAVNRAEIRTSRVEASHSRASRSRSRSIASSRHTGRA